jgi:hypothetical protein
MPAATSSTRRRGTRTTSRLTGSSSWAPARPVGRAAARRRARRRSLPRRRLPRRRRLRQPRRPPRRRRTDSARGRSAQERWRGRRGRPAPKWCWWRWGRVELPVRDPSPGTSYERVRCFVVDRPDGHRQPAGRSSRVSLDRAWLRPTRRLVGAHPRCMTLPPPAGRRWLPRSPYRLSGEGESRLAVASYFVLPPV